MLLQVFDYYKQLLNGGKIMDELQNNNYLENSFYNDIKEVLEKARKRIYRNIQSEMVLAYWQIGKMIVEKQGGAERSDYGNGLIKELSLRLTKDFGKGFTETNLRYMRMFYLTFPNRHALRDELSWTHYRLLISLLFLVFQKGAAVRRQLSWIKLLNKN